MVGNPGARLEATLYGLRRPVLSTCESTLQSPVKVPPVLGGRYFFSSTSMAPAKTRSNQSCDGYLGNQSTEEEEEVNDAMEIPASP